jgi:uncharacterized protein (DUF1697 family)
MALVVLLRGVNVGGHRTFRPSVLAKTLGFDAVSIGAAGTFVIRKPVARMKIRSEFSRRLPFDADVMICDGSEILRLASADPFAGQPSGPAILQFAGVMAKRKPLPALPLIMPPAGAWSLKIVSAHGRIVLGVCRREMKAIAYLGQLEKIVGVPVTTRSWNTILTIARALKAGATMAPEGDDGDGSARSI